MDTLFYLGLILVFGAFTEWLTPKLRVPKVVGYLILGLLIGPEALSLVPYEFIENSHIVIELSLSIIALLVGATLKFSKLKSHAKEIAYLTLSQSFVTFLSVTFGVASIGIFLDLNVQSVFFVALLLGAIATATDTAAPMAIVRETGAKGEFTSTFLSIVALDDALSLIIFTLTVTFGVAFFGGGAFEWMNVFEAFKVVAFSVGVGVIAGFLNSALEKLFSHHKGMETIATLGLIFIVYSLSEHWKLEPLLSSMIMGTVMVNVSKDFDVVQKEIDNHLIEIIFMLFFILSAMRLNVDAIFSFPILIEAYVLFRVVGKLSGAYLGAYIANSSSVIKKYIGLALLPQAGVAIGLALSLQKHEGMEEFAPIILNVVIATTFIHEMIGPIFTKIALEKSGEAEVK